MKRPLIYGLTTTTNLLGNTDNPLYLKGLFFSWILSENTLSLYIRKLQTNERVMNMEDIKVFTKRGNEAVIVDGKVVAAYDVERMEWYMTNEPLSDTVSQFVKKWLNGVNPFTVSPTKLSRYAK